MNERNGASSEGERPAPHAPGDQTPPLAQELNAVQVRYTWNYGAPAANAPGAARPSEPEAEPEADEVERLRAQVRHLAAALEDIVTLALSSADYKERAITMHRRAVAALTGHPLPRRPKVE
jgi:hypothetical protein